MADLSELKEQLGPSQRELMQQVNALAQEIQTLTNEVQLRDQAISERDEYIAKLEAAVQERDNIIEKLIVKIKGSAKSAPKPRVVVQRQVIQQQPGFQPIPFRMPTPRRELSEDEIIQKELNTVGQYNPNTAAGTNYLKKWNKVRPK